MAIVTGAVLRYRQNAGDAPGDKPGGTEANPGKSETATKASRIAVARAGAFPQSIKTRHILIRGIRRRRIGTHRHFGGFSRFELDLSFPHAGYRRRGHDFVRARIHRDRFTVFGSRQNRSIANHRQFADRGDSFRDDDAQVRDPMLQIDDQSVDFDNLFRCGLRYGQRSCVFESQQCAQEFAPTFFARTKRNRRADMVGIELQGRRELRTRPIVRVVLHIRRRLLVELFCQLFVGGGRFGMRRHRDEPRRQRQTPGKETITSHCVSSIPQSSYPRTGGFLVVPLRVVEPEDDFVFVVEDVPAFASVAVALAFGAAGEAEGSNAADAIC